jgi:hypothetical protein
MLDHPQPPPARQADSRRDQQPPAAARRVSLPTRAGTGSARDGRLLDPSSANNSLAQNNKTLAGRLEEKPPDG